MDIIVTAFSKVDRTLSPQEMLDTIGHQKHIDTPLVSTMPRGEDGVTEVFFFKIGDCISSENLEKEYESRGLKPDLYAQIVVNGDHPEFAISIPNYGQWKGPSGEWVYLAFGGFSHSPFLRVRVCPETSVFHGAAWFAGVRK